MTEKRIPRESQTRKKEARRTPWKPPSMLEAPEPPQGFVHRIYGEVQIVTAKRDRPALHCLRLVAVIFEIAGRAIGLD